MYLYSNHALSINGVVAKRFVFVGKELELFKTNLCN